MLLRPRYTPGYSPNDSHDVAHRKQEVKASQDVVYAQGSGMDGKYCMSDMACATDVIDDEGASTGSDERGAFANLGEQPPPRKRRSSEIKHMRLEASDATAHKRRRSSGTQDARSRRSSTVAARGLSPAEEEAVACLDEFAAFASKYKHQFADADEAEAVYGMVSLTHAKKYAEQQRLRQRGRQVCVTPPARRQQQQLQEAEGTTPDGEDASHATHSMHGTDATRDGESDGDQSGTEDASDHSGKSTPSARARHGKEQPVTQQQQQPAAMGPGMMLLMPQAMMQQGMMAPAMPGAVPAFPFMPPGLHPAVMPVPPFLGMGMPPWAFAPPMMFGSMGPMMMGAAAPGCVPTSVPAMVMGCPAPTVPAAATPAAGAPGQLPPNMMHMHHMAMHMVPPFMMPAVPQNGGAAAGTARTPAQATAAAQQGVVAAGAAAAVNGTSQAQPAISHQQGSGAVQQRAAVGANGQALGTGHATAGNGTSQVQLPGRNTLPAAVPAATAAQALPAPAATVTTTPGLMQKGGMTYPLPWMMVGGPNGMSPLQQQQQLVHAQAAMAMQQQQQLMQYHAQQQALAQQAAQAQMLGKGQQQLQQAQQRQQATTALQQFQRHVQLQASAAMGVPLTAVKQEHATSVAPPAALPQQTPQPAGNPQAVPAAMCSAAAKAGSLLLGQQLQGAAAPDLPGAVSSLPALSSIAAAVKQ